MLETLVVGRKLFGCFVPFKQKISSYFYIDIFQNFPYIRLPWFITQCLKYQYQKGIKTYCLSWCFIQTLLFLVSKCLAEICLLICDIAICSRLWNTQNTLTYPIEIHALHYLCKSMTHERYKWITLLFVEYQHLKYLVLYKLTGSIHLQFSS